MWRNVSRTVLKPKQKKAVKKQEQTVMKKPEDRVAGRPYNDAGLVFGGGWGGFTNQYGPDISEVTYFTVLRILSETVGKLPLYVRDKDHKIVNNTINYRLNVKPNENDTPLTLMSYLEKSRVHYGNGYAYCKWNRKTGELDGIYPLDPHRVRIWVDNVSDDILIKHYYTYENMTGNSFLLPTEDVIHVKNWNTDDYTNILGVPVRETLQDYMEANKGGQATQNEMYKAGMVTNGVLNYIGDMKDPLIQEMLSYTEKIGRNKRIIPLPDGWKLTPVNLSLADAQYLETRRYTALQVAAAYGVSPNQLNDYTKGSYANSIAQETAFLTSTLQYISRAYETEMILKLLSDDDIKAGVYIDMDTDAMLKNTPDNMAKIIKDLAGGSVMTINEARDMVSLPPMPNGDVLMTVPGSEALGGTEARDNEK